MKTPNTQGPRKVICRIVFSTLLTLFISLASPSRGEQKNRTPPVCQSCLFLVDDLETPIPLSGYWLFSRNDREENKDPQSELKDWVVLKTPGSWQKAYNDKKNFQIGWYRAHFQFDPKLIGQKAVILMNAYMAKVKVFLDGENIYQRDGKETSQKFYSIQAIPVEFTVTKQHHTLAIRIDTGIMKGVYQLPFELRKSQSFDLPLLIYNFYSGTLREIASYACIFFGLFFILFYHKTRYSLYLVAGLATIGIYPFYGFTSDLYLHIFDPYTLFALHYIGLCGIALFSNYFAQFFYVKLKKFNYYSTILFSILTILSIYLAYDFHLDLFQTLRKVIIFSALFLTCYNTYLYFKGHKKKPSYYNSTEKPDLETVH